VLQRSHSLVLHAEGGPEGTLAHVSGCILGGMQSPLFSVAEHGLVAMDPERLGFTS
jgi:hypothetical protein